MSICLCHHLAWKNTYDGLIKHHPVSHINYLLGLWYGLIKRTYYWEEKEESKHYYRCFSFWWMKIFVKIHSCPTSNFKPQRQPWDRVCNGLEHISTWGLQQTFIWFQFILRSEAVWDFFTQVMCNVMGTGAPETWPTAHDCIEPFFGSYY